MSNQISNKDCPVCGKPTVKDHAPFCSSRCKDVDLNRWLSGHYSIPGTPDDDSEGTENQDFAESANDRFPSGKTHH
ncbi:MAG: DNA gyrase inhibitor YacG [Hyphomicrobiales bacterium]